VPLKFVAFFVDYSFEDSIIDVYLLHDIWRIKLLGVSAGGQSI